MATDGRKTRYCRACLRPWRKQALSLRRLVLGESPLQRKPEMGAWTFRQKLERRTVRVRQLARDIKPEAGATGTSREKRLEEIRSRVGRYARPVVVQFADDSVAHVAGPCGDHNAALLFLA